MKRNRQPACRISNPHYSCGDFLFGSVFVDVNDNAGSRLVFYVI